MINIIKDTLLVASNNSGKITEIKELFVEAGINIVSAKDFDIISPKENGKSFFENSLIKAKYYSDITRLPSIADDSGLCVKLLDNQPGIYSADWAEDQLGNRNFNDAILRIYKELSKKIDIENYIDPIEAFFICNLTVYDPITKDHTSFEGRVDGYISKKPKGSLGFGYDPIFVKNGMKETFGEIDPDYKNSISHRADAFNKLKKYFNGL